MRNGDSFDVLPLDHLIVGQTIAPFAFGMQSGIQQYAMVLQIHKPGAGADVGIGIQIRDAHGVRVPDCPSPTNEIPSVFFVAIG
jgi:hypothetical protein